MHYIWVEVGGMVSAIVDIEVCLGSIAQINPKDLVFDSGQSPLIFIEVVDNTSEKLIDNTTEHIIIDLSVLSPTWSIWDNEY